MGEVVEFKAEPTIEIYSSKNFKIYGVRPDWESDIELNSYGNATIKGNFEELTLYNKYFIKAEKEFTKKYGLSYNVKNIYMIKPETNNEVKQFLESILTEMQVETIMENYPNIIDLVLNDELDKIDVDKLYNIGDYRLDIIIEKIQDNFKYMELTLELFDYNLSHRDIVQLYNRYPNKDILLEKFEENPYKVLCGLYNVGFKHADHKILNARPELKKSKIRLIEAIKYIISDANNQGDSIISQYNLKMQLENLDWNLVKLWNEYKDDLGDEILFTEHGITSSEMYIRERMIYDILTNANEPELDDDDNEIPMEWDIDVEKYRENTNLTEKQLNSLINLAEYNFSILIGVAGSGKTFTTKSIIKYLDDTYKSYSLVAPTGIASDIISNKTNRPASTIHRLLKYHPHMGFRVDEIQSDVVIVDEVSMVDINLMYNLLIRIDFTKTKLLLIADSGQIPSIGAGNVLHDLLEMEIFPTTKLTKVFRYKEGGLSKIAMQTYQGIKWVNKNQNETTVYGDNKDYVYYPLDKDEGLQELLNVYNYLIDNHDIDDIVVTMAYNKGDYGTVRVNRILQKLYNPKDSSKNQKTIKRKTFREGDRVLHTVNNYEAYEVNLDMIDFEFMLDDELETYFTKTEMFNGKIGKIIKITDKFMFVQYDKKTIVYDINCELNMLDLGYCVNIFKLQGSEFKNVVLFTPSSHTYLLNRNLIYTGMTRASERLIHIGDPETVYNSLDKSAQFDRMTNLQFIHKERMKDNGQCESKKDIS